MSFLLNDNITEEIQKQIYIITAKLGTPPSRIIGYSEYDVQVNWYSNGRSYMWRSMAHGKKMDWVEVYDGSDKTWSIDIACL